MAGKGNSISAAGEERAVLHPEDVATRGHGERGGVRRRQVPRSGTQETVEGSGVSKANGVPPDTAPEHPR